MEQSVDILCPCLVLISQLKTFYEVLQNMFAFICFVLLGGVTSTNNKLLNILFNKYIINIYAIFSLCNALTLYSYRCQKY